MYYGISFIYCILQTNNTPLSDICILLISEIYIYVYVCVWGGGGGSGVNYLGIGYDNDIHQRIPILQY